MADSFMSEVRMWGCGFSPAMWSKCSGQLLSISQHAALFSLIGTSYGGNGRQNFGLPDFVGRAPLHYGDSIGPGMPPYSLGEKGGAEAVALTESAMPVHDHSIRAIYDISSNGSTRTDNASGAYLAQATDGIGGEFIKSFLQDPNNTQQELMNMDTFSTSGAGLAHENRQPFLVVSFIISLQGTYPSRN